MKLVTPAFLLSATLALLPSAALVAQPSTTAVSPAARKIELARAAIAADKTRADAWNELALALARRARETADTAYYKEAWAATEQSLTLEPGNLEARKLQVWVLLGQHEFQKAADAAEALNRLVPDDVLIYGFLSDAYVELGKYEQAEKATQWMLDLRPGNVPGLTRAAHLRELFGDHAGAVEFMDTAYRRTADAETEDRAWTLTQIAHLSLLTCRADAAETMLRDALTLVPEYHYALARLSELRVQQGRPAEALDLRRRHYAAAPHPENLFELGVALDRAGEAAEARATFARFETAARAEMDGWDNANIELIYYYADVAGRPAEALTLARKEAARKQDVRTLEALAWAHYRNGQAAEAAPIAARVLAVGVQHPVTSYRAGVILRAAGQREEAARLLNASLASCPTSEVAADVRALLGTATR